MAGTLTISTLSDGTNSTSSTNCIQGSAKAWVNFDGTVATPTIRASYNVGSITKISSGKYTINFSNAMQDASYCVQASVGSSTTGDIGAPRVGSASDATFTSSAVSVLFTNTAENVYADYNRCFVSVFR